ncbi:DUF4376 domain-containing protein [Haemophilus influenzae]|uniref:DUF4376 domain-containing protein n=1 Tax=Haemophilus influenzae TaxID=727 RepID=UPI00066C964E|nr:DUF4376 domain-containing protein [Haemophilus influenzae]
MYFYDKKTNGFYIDGIHEIPNGSIELTDETYRTLLNGQSSGKQIIANKQGMPVLIEPQPSDAYELNLDTLRWTISKEKQAELLIKQRAEIRAQINTKRDECVNGGVFVPEINKWVDTDDKGRSTLVEIKADFDLNGKNNTYTLICADNTAQVIHFDEFKAVWNAVKTLKEKMYENAYMHKVLLEQSENPTDYNWSTGWSKTYQEHLNEQQA